MQETIYLDYNATTPLDPGVIEEMIPYMEKHFGNPSSSHLFGKKAKEAVELARERVAELLDCDPVEIVFTSGGSESNNHALKGVARVLKDRGNHIITTAIEHPAIIEPCFYLMNQGFDVTFLEVDRYGLVNPDQLEKAIRPETILITIMHANNEVGTIEPLETIRSIIGNRDILFHTDAAQSVGKIETSVEKLGVDLLSVAGHKLYAPKGIGAIYVRKGFSLPPIIHGAGQERGRRAGTENVPGIVGLGKACQIAKRDLSHNTLHMQRCRDHFENLLKDRFPGIRINGHKDKRLPNTSSLSFPNIGADKILNRLSYVTASAGAACHSGEVKISHVLSAMRIPENYAKGTLRFSVGKFTSMDEIERAADHITQTITDMHINSL